ncbi:MAG: class I SAM-dependent methyltransferase [Phycisphaerae bacterium]|nr:class I SAM-dependent methyltransferase [Phycisphaerae bacterium]
MSIVDNTLQAEYQSVHASKTYGVSGNKFTHHIQVLISELRPKSILNYGCGQTSLHEDLGLFGADFFRYDPGIPELSKLPVGKADFLINTDVLEHIPEGNLDEVLSKMASISSLAFFNIATRPAKEFLSNGKNAHCNIMTASQWKERLAKHFPEVQLVFDRPAHPCVFLTWDSPMKDVLVALSNAQIMQKKLKKMEKSIPLKIKHEFVRAKRRWLKLQ